MRVYMEYFEDEGIGNAVSVVKRYDHGDSNSLKGRKEKKMIE
jgi:hypothetical protein